MNTQRRDVKIRDVDVATWRLLRMEAVRRGWTTAELIDAMLRAWRHSGHADQSDDQEPVAAAAS